jgi:DNA-binding XRE family transcriptional regulator
MARPRLKEMDPTIDRASREIIVNFKRNIKRIKKSIRLTNAEMAKRMGLGLRSIDMLMNENNKSLPNIVTLIKFSSVLGMQVTDLFSEHPIMCPTCGKEME